MECRTTKVLTVFSSEGLDPGSAMACSYFYGFLKIILPASGGIERAGIIIKCNGSYNNNQLKALINSGQQVLFTQWKSMKMLTR